MKIKRTNAIIAKLVSFKKKEQKKREKNATIF